MLGEFISLYVARTNVEGLRTRRGAGDVVTTLLCYALETGIIDQALVVKMSDTQPHEAVPMIARSREEIIQASGSKYVYVPHASLRERMKSGAVIGLPCQMKKCPEKFLRIGLFCGLNLSPRGLEYAFKWHRIDKADITRMDYRGPDRIRLMVELRDGTIRYIKINTLSFFFTYPMCLRCRDFSSHYADISVGDSNFKGWSTVILRTNRGEELFSKAIMDGYIEADSVSEQNVVAAQTSSMFQKEVGGGYINSRFVRIRGKWIEALPICILNLAGQIYIFYQRYIKTWPERSSVGE